MGVASTRFFFLKDNHLTDLGSVEIFVAGARFVSARVNLRLSSGGSCLGSIAPEPLKQPWDAVRNSRPLDL